MRCKSAVFGLLRLYLCLSVFICGQRIWQVVRRAKTIKSPKVLCLVMPKHIVISIIRENAEVAGRWRVPSPVQLSHFERAPAQYKALGPFVRSVPCVTFDADFSHRASAAHDALNPNRPNLAAGSISLWPRLIRRRRLLTSDYHAS